MEQSEETLPAWITYNKVFRMGYVYKWQYEDAKKVKDRNDYLGRRVSFYYRDFRYNCSNHEQCIILDVGDIKLLHEEVMFDGERERLFNNEGETVR